MAAPSALDHLPEKAEVVTEFTVYSLCPYDIDDANEDHVIAKPYRLSELTQTRELMTSQQIGAVRAFLEAVRAFLEYVRHYAPKAEGLGRFVEPALETIWKL
jgi:hypothetical protein